MDGIHQCFACEWHPEGPPRAVVQLVHGLSEYVERYDRFARFLAGHGFLVCGHDHLGHGNTAKEDGISIQNLAPMFRKKIAEPYWVRYEYNEELQNKPIHLTKHSGQEFDLVLSGHAHGGQIRLPFTDGLFAPNQGLFPKYTSGKFKKYNTDMIVSRGLGNSLFPFRIFNRPELIVTTLNKQ